MDKPQKKAILEAFLGLYDFHTKLFHNVLVNVSDKDANNRLNTKANHMAWIAGSLLQQRYFLGETVGINLQQTSPQFFENFKGIQDNVTYPPLAEYIKDWDAISQVLKDAFANLSEEALNGPDPMKMPGGDYTFLDSIIFCVDRESYCIGQLGLLRRQLGYDAMKYD
ncbi:DinB family protein [Chitinophaga sp. MM2321]|uniref:DinB family protein n=1 Tax=Chitinophaga sp. MM2321 TaxID=3137178 RepID=UPI0032D57D8C